MSDAFASAYVSPSLAWRVGPHGASAYASARVPPGTPLLSLPYTSILSETYAESTLHGSTAVSLLRAACPLEATGRVILYLVMVAERAGSPGAPASQQPGRFARYLRSLPVRYDDPCWWPEDAAVARLKGTNLAHAAAHRLRWLARIHNACAPRLAAAAPGLFPPAVFTFSALMWAHSAFSSRGFPHVLSEPPSGGGICAPPPPPPPAGAASGDDEEDVNPLSGGPGAGAVGCMLPVLDVLNHGPRTAITWLRGPEGVSLVAGREGAGGAYGGAPIAAGAEVLNNYGPKSNEELLLAFGFVVPRNEDDTVALRLNLRAAGGELAALAAAAALPARHVCGRAGAPPSLLAAARLATLSGPARRLAAGADAPGALRAALEAPQCPASEARALLALREMLRGKAAALEAAQPWLRAGLRAGGGGGERGVGECCDESAEGRDEPAALGACDVAALPGAPTVGAAGAPEAPVWCAPPGAPAWPPPEAPAVARLRDRLAREYVRGQAAVLRAVEADVGSRLAALRAAAGREPTEGGAPAGEGAAPLLAALPGVACALRAPPGCGDPRAPAATAALRWVLARGAPPGAPALLVPARYLLCASRLGELHPPLARALRRVRGLRLPTAADAAATPAGARDFWDAAHAQLMLLLLAERRRRAAGSGGGVGADGGRKRGRGGDSVAAAAAPDWHAPWLALRNAFVDWAWAAFGGGQGSGAPPALPPCTPLAWPWGTRAPPAAPWGGARFAHGDLFPALTNACPAAFPAEWHTAAAWAWAEAVVEATAVPARPAGAPLQLALPLLFPLLPTPEPPPPLPPGAPLAAALARADPSLGLPPGAQWAPADGGAALALHARGGDALRLNPAAPAEEGGGGVFCEALPLPTPVEACALLEWEAGADSETGPQ